MASLIDSEAQFEQRLDAFGISAGIKRKLVAASIKSFAILAYAHGQPGQPIVDRDFDSWFNATLDNNAAISDVAGIKRLLFESQTLVLAALKDQITSSDNAVKRVPGAEGEARMKIVRNQLSGLLVEGSLEPAHTLLDMCASMAQQNDLKYIPPEKAVSRIHEVINQKTAAKQLDISADSLIVREAKEVPDLATHSAMQVKQALTRRGIGLLFADLIEYNKYARYLSTLLIT